MRGYAAALAEHYKGKIDRWEFWNEPNGGFRFWKARLGGDPPAFAALAVVAATAMRKANPGVKLALGGFFYKDYALVPGGPRFLEAALQARPELAELYDAVSFHPYKLYPPVNPPEMAGSWEEDQDATIVAWFSAIGGELAVEVPRFEGALPQSMVGMQGETLALPGEGEPLRLVQSPVYLRY